MTTLIVPGKDNEGNLDGSAAASHPPSSFDPTRLPSGSNSPISLSSPTNVANVLNRKPTYDRSTSQLGRYDSKRSSMISNSSFQTAPAIEGSAYGGGSVYGTADGGSSRASIDTVHGYTIEPSSQSGVPPAIHANISADAVVVPVSAAESEFDDGTVKVIPPPGNKSGGQPQTLANITNMLLETSVLHTSPAHSPASAEAANGLHTTLANGKSDSSPDEAPKPSNDTQEQASNENSSSRPAKAYSFTSTAVPFLHPSSAADPTAILISSDATQQPNNTEAAASVPQPTRRNTTGSTAIGSRSKAGPSTAANASTSAFPSTQGGPGVEGWDQEFDEDMKKQAEQIRRERKRRDEEAAQEERLKEEYAGGKRESKGKEKAYGHSRSGSAGGKSTGGKSTGGKSVDEWKPVVGNVVGEGHVNYILMYNMLTGIRVAVSRCQAKAPRALTDADFTAAHKYNFDVIGNELTPSAKYDFKFKDYAPWVFRSLREDSFNIDPADYLLSLTSKYILSELGSPGKSGSFFYYSRDYRFIIKTIREVEHKWLRRVLKDYYKHVKDNPHTLISRFYGLHRVKLPRGRKIHFVIMNNLFPAHRDIHETYDLKGSTVGRLLPDSKLEENPNAVMKDLNWIQRGRVLELGPYKRALLTEQLRRDVEFLKSIRVMDYSLLIGLHSVKRGNKENIRSTTLKVFKPDIKDVPDVDASVGARKWIGIKHAMEVRRAILVAQRQHQSTSGPNSAITESSPQDRKVSGSNNKGEKTLSRQGTFSSKAQLKERTSTSRSPLHALESSNLPDIDPAPSDRSGFIFYDDDGGFRATDDVDKEWRGGMGGKTVVDGKVVYDPAQAEKAEGEAEGDGVVYYMGVIDILTKWTLTKKLEHVYKGMRADRRKISPVNPNEYGDRFFAFLQAIMRGGSGGESFV
ncbi:SAICAR synthase-like protein [Serendipita vermifera]|nr:SAICAR synthase-like protein [Serendipita vermifera]